MPGTPPDPPVPYHHGDLHRALLDGARQLLDETGRWDFSLREVARRAGVSHAAPYRHFADKHALLAALGTAGYAALRAHSAAATAGITDPPALLAALGNAYIAFGTANPALYRLMFGPALPRGDGTSPAFMAAVATSRGVLRDAILAGARDGAFRLDPDDPAAIRAAAVAAWSLVHGLTLLTIDRLAEPGTGAAALDYTPGRVVALFVAGLRRAP